MGMTSPLLAREFDWQVMLFGRHVEHEVERAGHDVRLMHTYPNSQDRQREQRAQQDIAQARRQALARVVYGDNGRQASAISGHDLSAKLMLLGGKAGEADE